MCYHGLRSEPSYMHHKLYMITYRTITVQMILLASGIGGG